MIKLPKLQELRIENGLTREELAKLLNVSVYTCKAYELGYREPNIKTLKKLAEIFKCTTDDILREE